jgi:uncharacterized protein YrrD
MYVFMSQLEKLPVMSLQTGEAVARIQKPVIKLDVLKVLGFVCETARGAQEQLVLAQDIRQVTVDCIIIDSEEELSEPEGIIRLQRSLEIGYDPMGKLVVTQSGQRVGIIKDYSLDVEGFWIHRFYVRSVFSLFNRQTKAVIDRSQIIDITPRYIMVRDPTEEVPLVTGSPVPDAPA